MDCHIFLIRPAKYQTCLSDQWKCFQRFLAACGLIGLVLLNRKPLLPSPYISQSEPSRRETWRWDLNRLTTSWRVRLSPCVICSWFQRVIRYWLLINYWVTIDRWHAHRRSGAFLPGDKRHSGCSPRRRRRDGALCFYSVCCQNTGNNTHH